MKLFNADAFNFLENFKNDSIQLILTDPPYRTGSKKSGTERHLKRISNGINNDENEWELHADKFNFDKNNSKCKENYMKYGSVWGKKFLYQTEFSEWDDTFKPSDLIDFLNLSYKKIKKNGVIVIFFDMWKMTNLRDKMINAGFKNIKFIEWVKTNACPRNSSKNYLINCREIALVGFKIDKDMNENDINEIYKNQKKIFRYPIYTKKDKFHPTQKSVKLFKNIIEIYSKPNDLVIDPYCGSATTLIASLLCDRRSCGSEICKKYYESAKKRLEFYEKEKEKNKEISGNI